MRRLYKSLVQSVRRTCFCFVILALSGVSVTSFADTVLPISTTTPAVLKVSGGDMWGPYYSSVMTACNIGVLNYRSSYYPELEVTRGYMPPTNNDFAYCYTSGGPYPGWAFGLHTRLTCVPDGGMATTPCSASSCPANSTGTPNDNPTVCTCNDGYVADPTKTSCVQETYTLTLTPESATIEPGKKYLFTATVTKQGGGAPSKQIPVNVKVEVDPTSGGHDHGEPPTRPKGSVVPSSGNNELKITFTATEVSGIHTITATCDECSNSPQTAEVNVKVKESDAAGWDSLSASPSDYELIGGGEEKNHHDNHYLTESARNNLLAIVRRYNQEYPAGPVLHLNDASLVWGGKLDISGKWIGYHYEHLRGKEIDIRANQEPTAISFWRFADFRSIAADNGASASVHCSFPAKYSWACWFDLSENRHFHVRLTGR